MLVGLRCDVLGKEVGGWVWRVRVVGVVGVLFDKGG